LNLLYCHITAPYFRPHWSQACRSGELRLGGHKHARSSSSRRWSRSA
jgi:hypothetical protein